MPPSDVQFDATAWMNENEAEGATIQQSPSETIVPAADGEDSAARRAFAVLQSLRRDGDTGDGLVTVGDTIGQGGMGIVRTAEQIALGRQVAVKTLRPDLRSNDAVVGLLREAWVTGALEHPNIVPVHHMGLDSDGRPIIVLKKIDGVEWAELISNADAVAERFGETDLLGWNLAILQQVLNAVRYAHSRGILHRDLKPQNVMIGSFGEVYVLDWGIAVSLRADDTGRMPQASDATGIAGTAHYMAPEMLRVDDVPLSERTDLYLVGSILFEILTGAAPHKAGDASSVLAKIALSEPAIPDDAPARLADICRRAMARDPADRHESAEHLQEEIAQFLKHRGSEELAQRAHQTLDELAVQLEDAPADDAERRQLSYRLFGECRFGFREALAAMPDNQTARSGLARASELMIRYELGADNAAAASALAAEVDDLPRELADQVAAAVRAERDKRARFEQLEELGRDHDESIGTRTRTVIALIAGTLFTSSPLALEWWEPFGAPSIVKIIQFSAAFLAFMLGLGYWARETMMKTAFNRRISATAVLIYVSQTIMAIGASLMDLRVQAVMVLMLALWFVIASMATIALDRRVLPTAIGFMVCFLAASQWPERVFYFMALGNGILTINTVWVWRPRT